jgi:hypothetical protein
MFEGDSWSNWQPDPRRAYREHDCALEPYASMFRDELLEAMRDARGGLQWEFLREFALDKCAPDELRGDRFLALLMGHGEASLDEFFYPGEAAGMATRLIPAGGGQDGPFGRGDAGGPPPGRPSISPVSEQD